MLKPRKRKVVRIMPPAEQPIRASVEAVITDVTTEWVLADIVQESWRFRAGTGLLLRRAELREIDGQLVAPEAALARVYPPHTRNPRYAAQLMDQIFRR